MIFCNMSQLWEIIDNFVMHFNNKKLQVQGEKNQL
jgi:hypothetical protein